MSEIITSECKAMSTREIAELTGKEHKHVLRDAETMLAELSLPIDGYAQNTPKTAKLTGNLAFRRICPSPWCRVTRSPCGIAL
jgi:phage regulator Rha-like protein